MKAKLSIGFLVFTFLISLGFCGEESLYNSKKGVLLNGVDVVSILNSFPLDGKKEFSAEKEGIKYYFANKVNLDKFNANSAKYTPAFGGWCAYAMVEKPQKVDVNPKSYKIVNGHLLLFYNAWGINTLQKWNDWADDEGKFKEAQANWEKLKLK